MILCAWCRVQPAVHQHHRVFRSRAPQLATLPQNLVWLCMVCHDAAHGIRLNDNGFSCQTCRLQPACATGTTLYAHIESPETL